MSNPAPCCERQHPGCYEAAGVLASALQPLGSPTASAVGDTRDLSTGGIDEDRVRIPLLMRLYVELMAAAAERRDEVFELGLVLPLEAHHIRQPLMVQPRGGDALARR